MKIIIIFVCFLLINCVPKENINSLSNSGNIEYNGNIRIENVNNSSIYFESENKDNSIDICEMEWIINENIFRVYRFKEFTQFDFNARNQTQRQNSQSRSIFEEHFSKGAVIVGMEDGRHYMKYSYPRFTKGYFNMNSPIVSGSITGGTISDYFEYRFNDEVIEFNYSRIREDETDEYRNLLLSTGIFDKINITKYNIYQFSSYNIIEEEGRNINLDNILNAKVYIFKEEEIESYIIYYNIPDETIIVVSSLNGVFVHYLGEHISSYEHKYYFQDNKLNLHVKIHAYYESGIIHEYYIEFEKMQNGT
ncbi:MAG: hypothetical protein FWD47_05690 [Treponema sp.]|nr:hypothetical protein [Treponema sp.]